MQKKFTQKINCMDNYFLLLVMAFLAFSNKLTAAFFVAIAAGFAACAAATETVLVLSQATPAPDFALTYVLLLVTLDVNDSGRFPGCVMLFGFNKGFLPGSADDTICENRD